MSAEKLKIKPHQVDVWIVNQDITSDQTNVFLSRLNTDEKIRANGFYFEKDKRHYIASRYALRQILAKYLPLSSKAFKFSYSKFEKPYLIDSEIHFNVSHSFGVALIALSKHPIGVDVEWYLRTVELVELAQRFFSKKESEAFLKLDSKKMQKCFFEIWTKKEAVIKAIGDGLTYTLDQFHVNVASDLDILQFEEPNMKKERWTLKNIPLPQNNFLAALAVRGKITEINLKDFEFPEL